MTTLLTIVLTLSLIAIATGLLALVVTVISAIANPANDE